MARGSEGEKETEHIYIVKQMFAHLNGMCPRVASLLLSRCV